MARLILHAGMPKTGTDTIQLTLSQGAWGHILRDYGIHYLTHPSIYKNHSRYFHALCGQPKQAHPITHERNVARFTEAVRSMKDGLQPNSAILISAESVTPIAQSYANLNQVAEFIARFFSDIFIIAYVREPLSYMCSRIQQGLKCAHPLHRVVDNVIAQADCTSSFRNLESLFGASNMAVRPYDRQLLIDGEIVTDFCLGALRIPDSPMIRNHISRRTEHNFSLTNEILPILMSLYAKRSITSRDCCSRFVNCVSAVSWAGTKFDVTFFPDKIRRRLLTAADMAREQIRSYLGYDCFPSYRPVSFGESHHRSVQEEMAILRQNIAIIKEAIHDHKQGRGITDMKYVNDHADRGGEDPEDARSEAYDLLDHLYELCENSVPTADRRALHI